MVFGFNVAFVKTGSATGTEPCPIRICRVLQPLMSAAFMHIRFPQFTGAKDTCSARGKYNNSMSDLPTRIRKFRIGDFEALFQIDQICFPPDIAFSRRELLFALRHPKSSAWIAEDPGRILGFAVAQVDNRSCAHILTLDVIPEARQRRIGTALMNKLHADFKRQKITRSILEVGVHNIPAQRLYEKLHYQYVETLIGYYRGRQDAYRMMRVHAFTG